MPDPLIWLGIALGGLIISFFLFWPTTGVIPRWRAMRRVTNRVLQEHAHKPIQKLTLGGKQPTMQTIAGAIEVNRNQAVKTLTELEESGLLECEGEILHLTPEGERISLNIIRAHRLWYMYLSEQTCFDESVCQRQYVD